MHISWFQVMVSLIKMIKAPLTLTENLKSINDDREAILRYMKSRFT